jgi:predicted nucleotidyltransferase
MSQFGLKQDTINQINQIFSTYPEISKAIIYGSRTKGNYKPGSDIDLTLVGDNINHHQLLEILNKIDDLLLPYFCDLSIFNSLNNPNLIEHIERVGITFYKREVYQLQEKAKAA